MCLRVKKIFAEVGIPEQSIEDYRRWGKSWGLGEMGMGGGKLLGRGNGTNLESIMDTLIYVWNDGVYFGNTTMIWIVNK